MKRILVVEDESKIARLVRDYLEHAGFEVVVAADGDVALAEARRSRPDLVVLDLGLPGRDGLDVARGLRRVSNVPIVMLTARGDETDRIVGLELGADDYVVKPFSPKELVARVRAVLRRTEAAGSGRAEVLRVADVEVDLPRMRVAVGGRPVELTPTEFQLLAAMVREPGRVFTRGQLLDAVHGVAFESYERAVDAHVKNLRKKIEPTPAIPATSSPSTASATGSPMPDWGPAGRRHRRYPPGGYRPGRRPPWWPEGEPFPPAWGSGPRRFPRRVGLVVALVLGFFFVAGGFAWRWSGGGGVRAGGRGQGLVGAAVPADHPGAARGGVPGRAGGAADGGTDRGRDGGRRPGRRRGLLDPGPGARDPERSAVWPARSTR